MYRTEIFTPEKENNAQTITTLEIAEMMNMRHDRILRKLEGQDVKGKHTEGVIEILTRHNLGASDYFIPATYKDESGKENKCYKITKLGCDFLANKFSGEKGVVFTARYVKRFAEMEQALRQPPLPESFLSWYELDITPPKVPIFKSWYKRNKGRIYRMCKKCNVEVSDLYHFILKRIGERYDLDAANAIYEQETGHAPAYAMDIVEYFPELGEEADKLLDSYRKI